MPSISRSMDSRSAGVELFSVLRRFVQHVEEDRATTFDEENVRRIDARLRFGVTELGIHRRAAFRDCTTDRLFRMLLKKLSKKVIEPLAFSLPPKYSRGCEKSPIPMLAERNSVFGNA